MIIEPNWTITDQGPWQLIYNETSIISLQEAKGITSTEGTIFVGTKEECEQERQRLGLPWAYEVFVEPPPVLFYLIYDDQYIISLTSSKQEPTESQKIFIGTYDECEAEIQKLGLPWDPTPLDQIT